MKKLLILFSIILLFLLFQNCEGLLLSKDPLLVSDRETLPSINEGIDPIPSAPETENFSAEEKAIADQLSKSLTVYITGIVNGESYAYWSISDKLNGLIEGYKYSSNPSFLKRAFTKLIELQEIRSQNLAIPDFIHNKPVPALISNDYTCGYFYANLVQNMIIIEKGAYVLYELLKNNQLSDSDIKQALKIIKEYDETFEHFDPEFKETRNAYAYSDLERTALKKNCPDITLTDIHPLNMNTATGLAHFHMYRLHSFLGNLNLKNTHKDRFAAISRLVKKSLNLISNNKNSFYSWDYVEGGRVEDTNHAALTIEFIMTLYGHGWAFTKDFLIPLAETYFFILNDKVNIRSHLSENYGSVEPLKKYHRVINAMTSLCLIDDRVYNTNANLAAQHGEPTIYSIFSREKFKSQCSKAL